MSLRHNCLKNWCFGICMKMDKLIDRQTDRQIDRQTEWEKDKTDRQIEWARDREKDRDNVPRERNREKDREGEKKRGNKREEGMSILYTSFGALRDLYVSGPVTCGLTVQQWRVRLCPWLSTWSGPGLELMLHCALDDSAQDWIQDIRELS